MQEIQNLKMESKEKAFLQLFSMLPPTTDVIGLAEKIREIEEKFGIRFTVVAEILSPTQSLDKETIDQFFPAIQRIIAKEMELELFEVTLQSDLIEDLNVDSISHVSINAAIEEEFDIDISLEDMADMKGSTVEDYVRLVAEKKA